MIQLYLFIELVVVYNYGLTKEVERNKKYFALANVVNYRTIDQYKGARSSSCFSFFFSNVCNVRFV